MENNPAVSVVINTYNHGPYIAEAIESVLRQKTSFPFEIVIGEDESKDGTREICQEYAAKYPDKIRLHLRSRKDVIFINGHPTGRNNFTQNVYSAKGKYIALLPGDDYWTDDNKLQKQYDILEKDSSIICCHHWHRVSKKNAEGNFELLPPKRSGDGYWKEPVATVREIFANKLRVKARSMMFRNIFREGFRFPEWYFSLQYGDVPLSMLLGEKGNFAFIDEEMAVYRFTGEGSSVAGIRNPMFMFNHNLEWIKTWETCDLHFGKKYHKEATHAVMHFYKVILNYYQYDKVMFRNCARYAFRDSKLSAWDRYLILFRLIFLYFRKSITFNNKHTQAS